MDVLINQYCALASRYFRFDHGQLVVHMGNFSIVPFYKWCVPFPSLHTPDPILNVHSCSLFYRHTYSQNATKKLQPKYYSSSTKPSTSTKISSTSKSRSHPARICGTAQGFSICSYCDNRS
jgi:hypothetical protein